MKTSACITWTEASGSLAEVEFSSASTVSFTTCGRQSTFCFSPTLISILPFFFYFFFFFYLILKPLSLSLFLSLALSFSTLFFFFYLISEHSLALSMIRNGERGREKEQVRDLACSTVDRRTQAGGESAFTVPSRAFNSAAAYLPPQHSPNGSNGLCLFFFFYCYDLINFNIVFLSLYFDYA